jgi:hypothetical protein
VAAHRGYGMNRIVLAMLCLACMPVHAGSRDIDVYSIDRQYWDVLPGDTLVYIAAALLPGSPQYRQRLMDDILHLNPDAFIDGDPGRLRAHTRLWLPNTVTTPVTGRNAEIERFDWGYIKRQN